MTDTKRRQPSTLGSQEDVWKEFDELPRQTRAAVSGALLILSLSPSFCRFMERLPQDLARIERIKD